MATPRAQLPVVSNSAPGSSSADDTTDTKSFSMVKGFVNMLNGFKETDGFLELTRLVKQVEVLQHGLDSRDRRLAQLEEEKKVLQDQHDIAIQASEASHQRSQSKITAEKERLSQRIISLTSKVKEHSDKRAKLEDQGTKKDAEIVKLTESLRGSEEVCKRHSQKANESEKRFQHAKGETLELRGELQRERSEMTELDKAKAALEDTHNAMLREHNSTKAELSNLQRLSVNLKTEDLLTTTQRLESMWQSASSLVKRHLQAKLVPDCLTDPELWKHLKSPTGMAHTVPLPRSDTPAARDMRSAVVLAYLFHKINLDVFQPNYAMHEDLDGRRSLLLKAVDNSRDESLYRSFLLSVCPEAQTQIVQERATVIVGDVIWLVQGILSVDQVESFRADLHNLVDSVCTAWQKIQRLSTRFEPHMEYTEDEDFEWQALQLESTATMNGGGAPTSQNVIDRAELVIFPRLYIAKDGEPRPVTSGVVLRHSQTTEAAEELRNENLSGPTFGRGLSSRSRSRRDSVPASEALSRQMRSTVLSRGTADRRSD